MQALPLAFLIVLNDLALEHLDQKRFRRQDIEVPVLLNAPVKIDVYILQRVLCIRRIVQMDDRVSDQRSVRFFIHLFKVTVFHSRFTFCKHLHPRRAL